MENGKQAESWRDTLDQVAGRLSCAVNGRS